MSDTRRLYSTSSLSCLSLAAALLASPIHASANPTGGVVSAGSATITSSGNTLNINQSSSKAVIDWRSFDINSNETTNFNQPSSSAITLNRVNSSTPSQIFGTLNASGNIIIINQNGVLFGGGSKVDVNSLVATTADIDNRKFMTSDKLVFDKPGNPNASIINNGTITAKQAGMVGLVAPNVINNGTITANLGTVQLASADKVTVDFYGDKLMEIAVGDDVKSQLVSNTGTINAAGGKINLTAAASGKIVNSLINVQGELKAPSISQHNGEIIIGAAGSNGTTKSGSSKVVIKAKLNVSGKNSGEKGGTVTITGDDIDVQTGSVIDASGSAGGGTIKIGGDLHGQGTIAHSNTTTIEDGVQLINDAIDNGNGGNAVIWSDEKTIFNGTATAKGGTNGGNGGYVEISSGGIDKLAPTASINTSAPQGKTGTLLLDPQDIEIANGGTDTGAEGPGTDSTIDPGYIAGLLVNNNVSLQADNNITVTDILDASGGGTNLLTLQAGNDINVNNNLILGANSLSLIASNNLNINSAITATGLNATGNAIYLNTDVTTNGGGSTFNGPIYLTNNSNISDSNYGNITFNNTIDDASYGSHSLTINTGGQVSIYGNIGWDYEQLYGFNVEGDSGISIGSNYIYTAGGGSTFNGGSISLDNNLTLNDNSNGNITFNNSIYSYGNSSLNISTGGTVLLSDVNYLYGLNVAGYGGVYLTGSNYTTEGGGYLFSGPTYLGSPNGGWNNSIYISDYNSGQIEFNSKLDDTYLGSHSLYLYTNGGAAFNDDVGSTMPLNSLNITAYGGTSFYGTRTVNTSGGGFTLNSPLQLDGNLTINENSSGTVNINGSIDDPCIYCFTVNINAPNGSVYLNSDIGDNGVVNGFNLNTQYLTIDDYNINSHNSATLNGNNFTLANGTMEFPNAIILNNNLSIQSYAANIQFDGTIDDAALGIHGINIQNYGGITYFNSDIGDITPINSLNIYDNNGIYFNNNNVTTAGGYSSFYGSTYIRNNLSINDNNYGSFYFNSIDDTSAGSHSLSINTNGYIYFNGDIGDNSPLYSFSVTSSNPISLPSSITTSGGGSTFNAPLQLTTGVTVQDTNGGDLSFGTIDSQNDNGFAFVTSGTINFNGAIGSVAPTYNVYATASRINIYDNITSGSSGIQFNGPVYIYNNLTIAQPGNTIIFNGTIDDGNAAGTDSLTLKSDYGITAGAIGSNSAFNNVSIISDQSPNISSINATGTVGFDTYSNYKTIGIGSGSGDMVILDALLANINAGSLMFGGTNGNPTNNAAIDINTGTTFNSPVTFNSNGPITTDSAIILGGTTSFNSNSGNVAFNGTLDSTSATNLSIVAGGNVTFSNALGSQGSFNSVSISSGGDLTLPSITANTIFAQTTGANSDLIIDNGSILTSVNGAAGDITLVANHNFINNEGAGALQATNGGSYLVYSTNPTDGSFNGLTNDFHRYSCTYGGSCPTLGSGNGFLYGYTPTLTITAGADASHITYGDAKPTTTGSSYTVSGYVNGDSSSNNTITGSVTNSTNYVQGNDAGTYSTVNLSSSLLSLLGYGFTYADNTSGLVVDKKSITASWNSALEKTYGNANPTVDYHNFTFNNLYGGDAASLFTATANFGIIGANSNAGTYTKGVSASFNATNYTVTNTPTTNLVIDKRNLTVTTADKDKTYGATDPIFTGSATGLTTYDSSTEGVNFTYAPSGYTGNAGSYTISSTANDANNRLGNYNITDNYGTFTVNQALLNIASNNKTKTYGDANPTYDATFTGLTNNDTASSISGLTFTGPAVNSNVGSYTIAGSGATSSNYIISYTNGHLTIDPKTLIVGLTGTVSKTYDGTNAATLASNNYTLTGIINSDSVNLGNYTSGTYNDKNAASGKSVSVSGLTIGGSSAGNYVLASNAASDNVGTILARTLTIGAFGTNKTYDGNITDSVSLTDNRIAGDVLTDAYGSALFSDKNAANGKTVTVSDITLSGSDAGNYTYNTSTSTTADIIQRALIIGATGSNKTYDGNTIDAITLIDNRIAGDILTDAYGSALFSDKHVANGKSVNVAGISLTGTDASNYSYNSTASTTANITPRALLITATSTNKTYDGNTTESVTLTDNRVAGDVLSDTYGSAAFSDKNAANGKTVNVFSLSLSGTDAGNYTYNTSASTTANITQRALLIGVNGSNKTYDGNTTDNVTLSDNRIAGDVLTDGYSSALFSNKNAGNGETVNVSGITLTGTDSGNYSFNTTASTSANITQLALIVGATGTNKTYDGNTNATVTLTDNRIAGDVLTDTYGSAAFSDKNAANGKIINVSGITLTGTDAGNYSYTTTAATTANITPKALAVTADSGQHKTYGDVDPTLTYGVSGLVVGDSSANFIGALSRTANNNAGTYAITQGSLVANGNYTIGSYTDANFKIDKAALSITADNKTRYYGDANPTFTATYNGLTNGDDSSVINGLVFSTSANVNSTVNNYAINLSGGSASNYTISGHSGVLTVNPATLTVTPTSFDRYYAEANPNPLTGTITGFKNGQDDSFLNSQPVYSTTATTSSPTGYYDITASGASASANYTFNYLTGTLEIDPIPGVSQIIIPNTVTQVSQNPSINLGTKSPVNNPSSSSTDTSIVYSENSTSPSNPNTPSGNNFHGNSAPLNSESRQQTPVFYRSYMNGLLFIDPKLSWIKNI